MNSDLAQERATCLYSPSLRQVGCVLLNAAFQCEGYKKVNYMFGAGDWFTSPVDDMIRLTDTLETWDYIARLPRDQRPGPEHIVKIAQKRA